MNDRGYGRCERLGNENTICSKPQIYENALLPVSIGALGNLGNSLLLSEYMDVDEEYRLSSTPAYSWAFVAASKKLTTPQSELTVEVRACSAFAA